jgi:hypothetical protein
MDMLGEDYFMSRSKVMLRQFARAGRRLAVLLDGWRFLFPMVSGKPVWQQRKLSKTRL